MSDHEPEAGIDVVWTLLAALPADPDTLDDGERARAARLLPVIRERWVAGRAWVRARLAERLGYSPAAVPLTATTAGRPMLPGTGVALSIAHTDAVIVLATAADPIGVDIEGMPPAHEDLVALARVVGTPAEVAALAAADDDARPRLFQRWWVAKEAVLKAEGSGFLTDPRRVDVGIHVRRPPSGWQVHELGDLVDGQFCAVAGGPGSLVLRVAQA